MRKFLLYLVIVLAAFGSLQAGGGWIYGKGKGFFKLGQNMIRADRYFGPGGDIVAIPTISLYTSSLYAEYGLSDRFNAIIYMPFIVRSTLNEIRFRQSGRSIPGDEVNAFGDTDVGIKYGIIKDQPFVLAASLIFGIPLGETRGGEGMILQTGDGEFNQLIKLEGSYSFGPVYLSGLIGFNNRTSGFSEELHYGLEVGGSPLKFLTVIGKLYSVNSFFNGDALPSEGNSVFSNNLEYLAYSPEVIVSFAEKIGMTASAGFAFSGKRILANPNYGIGFYMKL